MGSREPKKVRTPIPGDTAGAVLFRSDRTCCVCRERGKHVQIHHIDEDPANHDEGNLAVLCFDCHELTQVRGGFGRKLDAEQVRQYRDDWIARVTARRDKADEIAAVGHAGGRAISSAVGAAFGNQSSGGARPDAPEPVTDLSAYIWKIPGARSRAYADAVPRWDSGVTGEMMQATYDVIYVMERVLVHLASFYPPKHFGEDAEQFTSRLIGDFFEWHRAHLEPRGAGKHGTMVGPQAAGNVLEEVERMVVDMVSSLATVHLSEFHWERWKAAWNSVG